MDEERKTSLEKMVATELLKLAMETDGERKARLKKMVATTQLRLVLETEDERRARLEYLSDNPIYIPNNLYLILIVALLEQFIIMHVFDMYLLCMIKARIRWCTCRVENILTLGKLFSLWFCILFCF